MNLYINKNGLIELDETLLNFLGLKLNDKDFGLEIIFNDFDYYVSKSDSNDSMQVRLVDGCYCVRNKSIAGDILSFYELDYIIFKVDYNITRLRGIQECFLLEKLK